MYSRTRLYRSPCQTARVAQRIHLAATPVQHSPDIAIGAGDLPRGIALQKINRHPPAHALLRRRTKPHGIARMKRRTQRPGLQRVAFDLVALDQPKNHVRRVARKRHHPTAKVRTEIRFHLLGIVLQSGIDLPAVAS